VLLLKLSKHLSTFAAGNNISAEKVDRQLPDFADFTFVVADLLDDPRETRTSPTLL